MPEPRMPQHRMLGRRRVRAMAVGLSLALFITVFSLDYTVKRGDTLGRIAHDHGVSVSQLAAANNIANPDLIFPGQVLVIPGKEDTKAQPAPEQEVIHVVKSGETLARIASKYGTTASAIAKANNISNVNLIRIGQKLKIPGTSASGGNSDAAARSDRHHIVKPGETLASIAGKYSGVSAQQIARQRDLRVIYSGTFVSTACYGRREQGHLHVKSGDRLASRRRPQDHRASIGR